MSLFTWGIKDVSKFLPIRLFIPECLGLIKVMSIIHCKFDHFIIWARIFLTDLPWDDFIEKACIGEGEIDNRGTHGCFIGIFGTPGCWGRLLGPIIRFVGGRFGASNLPSDIGLPFASWDPTPEGTVLMVLLIVGESRKRTGLALAWVAIASSRLAWVAAYAEQPSILRLQHYNQIRHILYNLLL